FGKHAFATFDTVDHGRDLRAIHNNDIAAWPHLIDHCLAGRSTCLDVVGHHRYVRAVGGRVNGDDHDAGGLSLLDGRGNCLGIVGGDQQHIDAGGDEIVDVIELLAQVIVVGNDGHLC